MASGTFEKASVPSWGWPIVDLLDPKMGWPNLWLKFIVSRYYSTSFNSTKGGDFTHLLDKTIFPFL
ncbi:hypothetical protein Lal_00022534 [Lupinus albus]|uniref:Uncharacterized protein n=1 Tax=Lupinus albus TaxID=3870 RepID=A0A6A5PD12_LUPAL|nr:hypothetical protein Lalb_Chr15g0086091 [Lupinus albus]KAF1895038.1 hypothetical protein Lal_00022534 [Lupinus albus]